MDIVGILNMDNGFVKMFRNVKIGNIDRFAFYERAKTAFAVIATGEEAVYANIILKKGVIK